MAKVVIAAFLWLLVGIMVGSFLDREFAQPTNVVRKIEGQRTQSAAAVPSNPPIPRTSPSRTDQKQANEEQKPPAPANQICLLAMTRNGVNTSPNDAEILYYPADTLNCSHPPHVDPSWHVALVRHLHKYERYLSAQGMVLLGFTVDRSGHVLNREVVTVDHGPVASRENSKFENEVISMIDRALPLPPFPDSMTEAKLIVLIYELVYPPTPPEIPQRLPKHWDLPSPSLQQLSRAHPCQPLPT